MEAEVWVAVAQSADERACTELALVLEARAIPWRRDHSGTQWLLCVRAQDTVAAARELDSYRRENARVRAAVPPPVVIGNGWLGVGSFIVVLLAIAVCVQRLAFGIDWLAVGRMDAARMLEGQWWRPLTALTLHVDADHLLANVAFGAFFTYFVGRYLGGGIGWIAILSAGTLGNVLNGWLAGPEHRSIGASTAVFGALGLLTAYTWRRGFPRGTSFRGRVAPLIAGIALLAYTGTAGENTDLGAHLLGFVVGLGMGFAAARVMVPASARVQLTAGGCAWLLVAATWAWGIVATY
jgi:membrane associated rhomboid family serine protease